MTSAGVNVSHLPSSSTFPILPTSPFLHNPIPYSPRSSPQVLRYTALGSGILYGFSHQSSLTAATKSAQLDREYKHKESLVAKAKAEWTKRTMPEDQKTRGGDGEFRGFPSFLDSPSVSTAWIGLMAGESVFGVGEY